VNPSSVILPRNEWCRIIPVPLAPKRRFWKAGQTFPKAFPVEALFKGVSTLFRRRNVEKCFPGNAFGKVCPAFQNRRLVSINQTKKGIASCVISLPCLLPDVSIPLRYGGGWWDVLISTCCNRAILLLRKFIKVLLNLRRLANEALTPSVVPR